ncbi:MAG: hypothetical protein Q7W55_02450 [Pseudohongiella sp.]|nr:hypothetical protein [Pseudohongiella sp.]MDO9521127.1 hypothetical protein [Pseudohongiella sp.]MDP2126706.1 hypothetical protein [Pseudohongiella sp.]
MQLFRPLVVASMFVLMALGGCATTSVKSTEFVPIVQGNVAMDEDLLMDIGVRVFDPGVDEISRRDMDRTNTEIRRAESRYAPYLMAETLQRSGNWGVVRVLPAEHTTMDIYLDGQILLSDGEGMIIKVTVTDSTGRVWYERLYEEHISQYNYDQTQRQSHDPFQVIYNNIANDLLAFRQRSVTDDQVRNIRMVSELQFAANFAPDIFGDYLTKNNRGITTVARLPADNDPSLIRMRDIRERDNLFVDTVQDYYATYARQMRGPYDAWRAQSYVETMALEEAERSARRRFITGAAAIAGGIAAVGQNNSAGAQMAGIVGVGAGAFLVRSGFERSQQAQMHVAALSELSQSLEAEVAPKVIELDDRQIMLTGTVEEQYDQWREILMEIYLTETGGL